ncbi:MAG: 23S rRNA (adenine(2503)-C2)-methyltransferase, partial [Chloroflexota bacterium]
AHKLGKLLKGLHCHVNIIPLNPTGGYAGKPADPQAINEFIEILDSYGISATVRVRRGIDIDAGCGQLKSNVISTDQIQGA